MRDESKPLAGQVAEAAVLLYRDVATPATGRGHSGTPAAHERIEDDLAGDRAELDERLEEGYGLLRLVESPLPFL